MTETDVNGRAVREQLKFFGEKRAGCLFAAAAARNPTKYGWYHWCVPSYAAEVDGVIAKAIEDPKTATASLLFLGVSTLESLLKLVDVLAACAMLDLDPISECGDAVCLGFRAKVGTQRSWVSGFGPFDFFPATRRTPYTELTMRVKPRPDFDFVFKEAPPGVLHLADMDMKGMKRDRLWRLWHGSHAHTARILGGAPDLRSAAKTTFSLPRELLLKTGQRR